MIELDSYGGQRAGFVLKLVEFEHKIVLKEERLWLKIDRNPCGVLSRSRILFSLRECRIKRKSKALELAREKHRRGCMIVLSKSFMRAVPEPMNADRRSYVMKVGGEDLTCKSQKNNKKKKDIYFFVVS